VILNDPTFPLRVLTTGSEPEAGSPMAEQDNPDQSDEKSFSTNSLS